MFILPVHTLHIAVMSTCCVCCYRLKVTPLITGKPEVEDPGRTPGPGPGKDPEEDCKDDPHDD